MNSATITGRDVRPGMLLNDRPILAIDDSPTWFHGTAGRTADLGNGLTVAFHADLPLHGVTEA